MRARPRKHRIPHLQVIPIEIVFATLSGASAQLGTALTTLVFAGSGLLLLPPLLMIVFREKYPHWWPDWNRELLRFTNRLGAYVALMGDRYPATDGEEYARLDLDYAACPAGPEPQAAAGRVVPRPSALLVLALLFIGVVFALIAAWFAILSPAPIRAAF